MTFKLTRITGLFAAGGAALAILSAPMANAATATAPTCTNVGESTTHCQTSGSNMLVTAPNPNVTNPLDPRFGYLYGPFIHHHSRGHMGGR